MASSFSKSRCGGMPVGVIELKKSCGSLLASSTSSQIAVSALRRVLWLSALFQNTDVIISDDMLIDVRFSPGAALDAVT